MPTAVAPEIASEHLILPLLPDSGAAVQSAIDALGVDGGTITLIPGDHAWQTVPKLPKNVVGRLVVRGPGAKVTLSAAAPRFLDFNRGAPTSAAQETFQNITVEDLYVDCANVVVAGKKAHVLLGNIGSSGSWQTYMNFNNIVVRRCHVVNIPTSGDNNGRQVVSLVAFHDHANEANQSQVVDIRTEECKFEGGMVGVAVMGSHGSETGDLTSGSNLVDNATGTWAVGDKLVATGIPNAAIVTAIAAGTTSGSKLTLQANGVNANSTATAVGASITAQSANVWLNRIMTKDVVWDSGAINTGFATGAGIQYGGTGYGGTCWIEDCELSRSWDVGIEVDSINHLYVRSTTVVDCRNGHFFVRNFHAPRASDGVTDTTATQRAIFTDCHGAVVNANPDKSATAPLNYLSQGFALSHQQAPSTYAYGAVTLQNCSYTCRSAQFTSSTGTAISADTTPIKRITIENFRCAHPTVLDTSTGAQGGTIVYLAPSTDCEIVVDNLPTLLAGSTSNAAMAPRHLQILANAANIRVDYDVRGFRPEQNFTGLTAGNTIFARLGNGNSTGNINGRFSHMRVVGCVGDNTAKSIFIQPSSSGNQIADELRFEDCDWTKNPGGFDITGPDTTNQRKVRAVRCKFRLPANFANPSVFTVPASGTFYESLDYFDEQLIIQGGSGTITTIDISRGGTTITVHSQAPNPAPYMVIGPLAQGDQVRFNYTVAPTVYKQAVK